MDYKYLGVDGLVIVDKAEFDQLLAEPKALNTYVATIRGSEISSKESLMDAFAAALRFPDYSGRNWDAVDDCITDLEWLGGQNVYLFVEDADDLLENLDCVDVIILAKVLAQTAAYWKSHGIEFRTALCGGKLLDLTFDQVLRPR